MNLPKTFDNLFTNRKYTVYCIVLTSIVVQSLFLFISTDIAKLSEPHDYINYYKPGAENILSGRGYVDNDNEFIVRYPPGYSLYLIFPLSAAKVTNISETTIVKVFSLCTLTMATLFFFLMVELITGTRLAFISSMLWVTYPFHIWLVKNPYSEIPFMLFFFGSNSIDIASLLHCC